MEIQEVTGSKEEETKQKEKSESETGIKDRKIGTSDEGLEPVMQRWR